MVTIAHLKPEKNILKKGKHKNATKLKSDDLSTKQQMSKNLVSTKKYSTQIINIFYNEKTCFLLVVNCIYLVDR